jgi:hypothetical protein
MFGIFRYASLAKALQLYQGYVVKPTAQVVVGINMGMAKLPI